MRFIAIVFIILGILNPLWSQIPAELLNQLKSGQSVYRRSVATPAQGSFQNIQNLDPSKYIVDAGDLFTAKIDAPGPEYDFLEIPVTGEGFAFLPQGISVQVKGKTLENVYSILIKKLKEIYKDSIIEVFLKSPRNVSIVLSLPNSRKINSILPATFTVEGIPSLIPVDTSGYLDTLLSDRFLWLFRDGMQYKIDLYRKWFFHDTTAPFYIQQGDFYLVPNRPQNLANIYIAGEVNQPGFYEYNQGDNLHDLVTYAGGFLPFADSTNIELYRLIDGNYKLKKINFYQNENILLQAGDRIYVRSKLNREIDWKVTLIGEVLKPGEYPVVDNHSTIKELIERSGGFTERASLEDALILRVKYTPSDREYDRLRRLTIDEMNNIEKSYYKIRSRQDVRKVVCNFRALFESDDQRENVALRDGDIIIIPARNAIVTVTGGVMNPGILEYVEGMDYQNYINTAGGFSPRALQKKVKIIKPKKGLWLDASKDVVLEPGDIIFIPEKEERDWWEMFKEGLSIATQLGTIALIILNLKNLK